MSVALYRKYRPKNFSEVTNQNHIKVALQNELAMDKLGHAYLFCGPRGTGKTTLARLLAKSANCENRQAEAEPCNLCANCLDLAEGRALDVVEIDAASHTGVDNVRENIIANARFSPTKGRYKVFIIDEVHMLSLSAFNALLKILEEPPAHVIFILATTEAQKLPATIISRCQRFDFKKINVTELTTRLRFVAQQEGVSVDEAVLEQVARRAGGCVRDAESLLEQILSLGGDKIGWAEAELVLPRADYDSLLNFFELLVQKNPAEGLRLLNRLFNDGADPSQFADSFLDFCRRALLFKISGDATDLLNELGESRWGKMSGLLEKTAVEFLLAIIKKFSEAREVYRRGPWPQLALELPLVELTGALALVSRESVPPPTLTPPVSIESPKKAPEVSVQSARETVKKETPPAPVAVAAEKPAAEISASEPTSTHGQIGLNEILSSWSFFLAEVQKTNYSCYIALCMGKPLSFAGNVLTIGFLFDIQRQKVCLPSAVATLHQAAKTVWQRDFTIEARLSTDISLQDLPCSNSGEVSTGAPARPISQPAVPTTEAKAPTETATPDAVSQIANQFGGEVV